MKTILAVLLTLPFCQMQSFRMSSVYVATTGSDSTGNGTSGAPWATINKALAYVPALVDQNYTINIADGTYAEGLSLTGFTSLGGATITFVGDLATMDNVVLTGHVTTPATATRPSQTAAIFVQGNINAAFEGMKVSGTPTFGFYARNNAQIALQEFHSATGGAWGILCEYGVIAQMTNDVFVDTATSTAIDINFQSRAMITSTTNGSKIQVTGPATTTPYGNLTCLHVAYQSQFILSAFNLGATADMLLQNCYYGIQAGLQSTVQFEQTNSAISVYNASVSTNPSDGSAAIFFTDQSSFSTSASTPRLQLQGFQYGVLLDSLSYAETTGVLARFYITTNTSTSQNSVTLGF